MGSHLSNRASTKLNRTECTGDIYQQVFDALPSLMWRSGLDAQCNYFNKTWLEFTGRTIEQEIGSGWTESIHPDDYDRCLKTYRDAFSRREPFEVEYRLRHHSGEYRLIVTIGRPFTDSDGNFAGYIGTCYDVTERVRMEEALRESNQALERANNALNESETTFKELFEQAPDAIVGVDQNGKIVLVNQQAEELFGYTREEMTGHKVEMLMPDSYRERHSLHVQRMMLEPKRRPMGQSLPLMAQNKNGRLFPIDINLGPLNTKQGLIMLATIRDTTDQKRNEPAIREREKMLTTAAMSAPLVFFNVDQNGIIRFSLGQSLARRLENVDSVGKSIYDVYRSVPKVIESFVRALSGETITTVIEAGGMIYETTYTPLHDENGEITGVVGVASEVTRHRKVEEALRKSEAHFRMVFNDAILGIKVIDLEETIIDCNPSFIEMTGYSKNELVEMKLLDLVHPDDILVIRRLLDDLINGKVDHFRSELRYQHRDGQTIWGRLAMSLFHSADGVPLYGIGMVENITPQKHAESELAEVHRRLIDSAELERLNLAQELHDGPLQELQAMTYRVSMLESMVDHPEGSAEVQALREEIQKITQSLRAVCGELRPPSLAPFGLEKAIRSHAEQFQERYPEIRLHLDLMNDGREIPERVRLALFRIYQHSIANIFRHSQARNVEIVFRFDDQQIELRIEDDGKGFRVPKRWIELVRQGHFGLVGSIERAESIGGKLEVYSRPGAGARVCVFVPRKEEQQVTTRERFTLQLSSSYPNSR
jgi:PAS domain S-box-containing protein